MEPRGTTSGFARAAIRRAFAGAALFAALAMGAIAPWPAPAAVPLLDTYYSPKNRERPVRASTRFIILHTTEGAARGSGSKLQRNGEANYMVDEAGRIYRVIDRKRVAYHCGRSMWNGVSSLDNCSVGIEVVGYHNKDLTAAQYKALKSLLDELKRTYRIPDDRVLTHSMVAYGAPNQWHRKSHRGRKRCAMRMALPSVRRKLGLNSKPSYDPDVRAGRLVVADRELQQLLYSVDKKSSRKTVAKRGASDEPGKNAKAGISAKAGKTAKTGKSGAAPRAGAGALAIGVGQTAWDVVRGAYNAHDTLYVFPGGDRRRGDEITNWRTVPSGTQVIVGFREPATPPAPARPAPQEPAPAGAEAAPAPEAIDEAAALSAYEAKEAAGGNVIGPGKSAWDIARDAYAAEDTIYEFPSGERKRGSEISNWKAIPSGTRVTVAAGDANEPERISSLADAAQPDGAQAQPDAPPPNQDAPAQQAAPAPDAAPAASPTPGSGAPAPVQAVLAAIAGAEWNSDRTIYVTENGRCIKGSELDDATLALLTPQTKVFSGYKVGGPVTAKTPAFAICGPVWRDEGTRFLFPGGRMESGDKVDPRKIPPNTMILYKD